jgi:hypothetical protein
LNSRFVVRRLQYVSVALLIIGVDGWVEPGTSSIIFAF